MNTRTIPLAVTILMLSPHAFADEPAADEILSKVVDTYEKLETYQSEGTIVSDIDTGSMKIKQSTTFSIRLKKPNLYLISWSQQGGPMVQSGNVWSDGTQPYLHMSAINAYGKMTSDEMALAGATGISGGAAFTIPALFLPVFKNQPARFSRLKDPQLQKSETIAGDDCYVISAASQISKKETYWISKKTHRVRQYRRSLETPAGGAEIPEMTDEVLAEAIKALGQEVNEETKKTMRQTMARTRKMIKTMSMKGSTTEMHTAVSSPELKKADFEFSPPQGAVLKESLLGGFIGGK